MGSTNYDWAALVMVRTVPPITPTANNCDNFTRWMRAENPATDWWHLSNPLNCGLDDGSADGEGSYLNLNVAALMTARVLSQANMVPIAKALRSNASLEVFSAGCAASAWSTGGYHGHPGFIASVPQEPVIASPQTFPDAGPGPAPGPPPTPAPPTTEEDMQICAYDPKTGGYWVTDENGDCYNGGGAPFVQGLNQHPDYKAGEEESAGQNPCVGITYWAAFGNDGIIYFTRPTSGVGGWTGTPYSTYRFLRSGQPA